MRLNRLMRSALCAGAILLGLLLVSAALWALLHAVGDEAGAAGAKGVLLVTGVCWLLDFVFLVVLLTLARLAEPPSKLDVNADDADPE